jgi:hypothetical protein
MDSDWGISGDLGMPALGLEMDETAISWAIH